MIGNTILFVILLISFDFTTFLIILIMVVNFFTVRSKIKFVLKNLKINNFNQKMRNQNAHSMIIKLFFKNLSFSSQSISRSYCAKYSDYKKMVFLLFILYSFNRYFKYAFFSNIILLLLEYLINDPISCSEKIHCPK